MIDINGIIGIYGPPGSGKTTLAIQTLIKTLKENKKVLYLDTEGDFSLERVKQIGNVPLDNLIILKIKNFKDQHTKINELKNIRNFSLIVIDTINNHYRTLVKSKPELANRMLINQIRNLNELKTPILILNQVYTDPNTKETKITGNEIIKRASDSLIELKKDPRRIIYKKENKECNFIITDKGIEVI